MNTTTVCLRIGYSGFSIVRPTETSTKHPSRYRIPHNNEAVLVKVSRPTEQREGETDEAFRKRKQDERVLALSPNFDPSA